MSIIAPLPTLPDKFRVAALALPSQVRAALPRIVTVPQGLDALARANAAREFARQIKAHVVCVNAIQEAILLLKARLGRHRRCWQGQGGGRGKKKPRQPGCRSFPRLSPPTISIYRRVADHAAKIDPYVAQVAEANAGQPDDSVELFEVSTDGFLEFVMNGGKLRKKLGDSSVEWYTPLRYIEAARQVMGGIDLDPASCTAAQEVVKATTFYTAEDDGLAQPWSGRVFLNPPYRIPCLGKFVGKLCDAVEAGKVTQAILLTNDSTDTNWWHRAAVVASSICIHRGRISFWTAAGKWNSSPHGQTFFYFGSNPAAFDEVFSQFGLIMKTAAGQACQPSTRPLRTLRTGPDPAEASPPARKIVRRPLDESLPPAAERKPEAKLTFGSVCAGIEGALVAFGPLGWQCRWLFRNGSILLCRVETSPSRNSQLWRRYKTRRPRSRRPRRRRDTVSKFLDHGQPHGAQ